MRIQTLAAAAVLSLAATIPLSTAAFADSTLDCVKARNLNVQLDGSDCVKELGQQIDRRKLPDFPDHQRRLNLCDGPIRGIIQDEKLHEDRDDPHGRVMAGKPCHDDESDHKRRSHDDPEEKSSHHKKSDDSDSDDSSDSDSSDGKADDDSDDDDDTTSTQVKVVPKGSVDTGDGSSL
jgi:hypothetical protein